MSASALPRDLRLAFIFKGLVAEVERGKREDQSKIE